MLNMNNLKILSPDKPDRDITGGNGRQRKRYADSHKLSGFRLVSFPAQYPKPGNISRSAYGLTNESI
jgi:hypothetical protein